MAKLVQPNFLDKAINFLNPKAGAERMRMRYANELMKETVRQYDGASVGRRTAGWNAAGTSAGSEIQKALKFLRDRSRELARNNPYAENAIREIANNVVGTGVIPKAVGLKAGVDKKLKELWKAWADGTSCDYEGHTNYYGLQNLVMRTVVESGECIVRRHIVADKNMDIPLKLQVLEPDFIDDTKYELRREDGSYILYGIEFNSSNKIVAYWLWNNHPGDAMQYATKSERIPSEEIIHVFEKKRPGQFRGVPFGHAAMLRLRDLDDYEDAQLIRQKIAACFTVFVTDNEMAASVPGTSPSQMIEKVEPGIIEHLPPGKQVSFANPPDAGQNYDPYVKSVLRGIASSYGMDYVTLTGDLSAVNFSSGRMGWLKFHRNVTTWQWNMLVPQHCNRTWDWFVQLANVLGFIKQITVPVTWTPPRRMMIDPVKEIEGIIKGIQGNITSLQSAIRENGDDPDEVLQEIVEMAKFNDDHGLMPSTDPRFDPARKLPPGPEGSAPPPTPPAKK